MSKDELKQHYLDTTYIVSIENNKHHIKINKPLSPVLKELVTKYKTAAVLTAWNPKSEALDSSQNKIRNIELNKNLNKYIVFDAIGQGHNSEWVSEESFLILGISKQEVETLAIKYEQNAYVWLEGSKEASLMFTEVWHS